MSSRRLVALLPLLLLGCSRLTQPNDGEPGYGQSENAAGSAAPKTLVANSGTATNTVKPRQPPPPPKPADDDGEKIRASHILVGWKGAAGPPQQRTKEEAKQRIDTIIARHKKGEDFAKLAGEFGEDGTKTKGGDLGEFDRGTMVKPFGDAAFALESGEVSGVVETQFGFHVIKRTK